MNQLLNVFQNGKEHKKYEFGNKVSIAITLNTGVIVGALGFRKEYDGHTLQPALEQVSRLTGKEPKNSFSRPWLSWKYTDWHNKNTTTKTIHKKNKVLMRKPN